MIKQSPIRVSVVGGSPIERSGLTLLLNSFPGIEVLPVDSQDPPMVMIWISQSDLSQLPDHSPESFLFIITDEKEIATFPTGVTGLFSKEESPEILATAIRQVARGEQYLSSSLAISILR